MKRETCEQILEKLRTAIKERERCANLMGLRLGMFKQTAEADREVRRLEKRLAQRQVPIMIDAALAERERAKLAWDVAIKIGKRLDTCAPIWAQDVADLILPALAVCANEALERACHKLCDRCRLDGPPRDCINDTNQPDDGGPRFVHEDDDGEKAECEAEVVRALKAEG